MQKAEDIRFLRAAVAAGRLRPSPARDVMMIVERRAAAGILVRAREVAVEKGLVPAAEAQSLGRLPALPAGATVAAYRLGPKLADGPAATAYLAAGAEGRRAVIKLFPRELAASGALGIALAAAAAEHAAVAQENLCRPLAAGADGVAPYFARQWAPGEDLARAVSRGGALAEREALSVGRQLAKALAALHARGLAHGGVRPTNVIVDPSGVARLTDGGILDALRAAGAAGVPASDPFAAPERDPFDASPATTAEDAYALGALVLALAGGPKAPARAAAIAERLCAPDPLARPYGADLVRAFDDRPEARAALPARRARGTRPVPKTNLGRRARGLGIVAALLLAAGTFVAGAWSRAAAGLALLRASSPTAGRPT